MPNDSLPTLAFAPDAGDVVVDLGRLVPSRLLITGDSGTGKSRLVRQLLEQTHGRIPHLVIDPDGDYATLRELYGYLLVGPGGELPADPGTAAALAPRLFRARASAILDLSELKPTPQRAFVAAFVGALMELGRDDAHPTLLVVDEAQTLAPEGARGPSTEALADVASRGRKRGLCLVAVTQRLSEVSKTVVGKLGNKVVFGTTLTNDLERSGKELGLATAKERAAIRDLAVGECLAYGVAVGPERRIYHVRAGDVRTTHLDVTRRGTVAPPPTPAAIASLVGELQDLARAQEAAEQEAADVEQLRAQVAELRAQLEARPAGNGVPDPAAVERATQAALARWQERVRALFDPVHAAIREQTGAAVAALDAIHSELDHIDTGVWAFTGHVPTVARDAAEVARPSPAPAAAPPAPPRAQSGAAPAQPRPRLAPSSAAPAGEVLPHAQRLLDALAELEAIRLVPAPRETVGAIAGLSHLSGPFRKAAKTLRESGLVDEPAAGTLRLTDAGRPRAHAEAPPRRLADFHARWLAQFGGHHARILEVLIEARGAVTRAHVGDLVGISPQSGPFRGAVKDLHTAGVVVYPAPGMLQASELLFPKGLR